MKTFVTFLFLMIGVNMYGQSDSIEDSVLFKKASSMEITGEDYAKIAKSWKETIKKINGYPDLPLNAEGKIQYSFVRYFPNFSKGLLYNRILEWFAITYGIVPTYMYSNPEDGKIICSNSLKISNNTTSSFSYVISIKDNKILMNIANLGYQESHAGYYSGDTWIPDSSNFYNIDQVFPVILKESSKWNYYLNMLITINKQMNNEIDGLSDFLNNYDSKYVF